MDAILGGLIGSIATVLITKILELIQKSKEHKYSLQKEFFLKKLASTESAVTQLYILLASIEALARMYERKIEVLERDYDLEFWVTMLEKFSDISNQIPLTANSFLLYFDVAHSFWDNQEIFLTIDKMFFINSLSEEIFFLKNQHQKFVGTEDEADSYERILLVSQELKSEIHELMGMMKSIRKELIGLLKHMRLQMKKYEA